MATLSTTLETEVYPHPTQFTTFSHTPTESAMENATLGKELRDYANGDMLADFSHLHTSWGPGLVL